MHTTALRPLFCAVTLLMGLSAAPAFAAVGASWCSAATAVPSSGEDLNPRPARSSASSTPSARAAGLSRSRDGDLAQAARKHSADMVRRNYFAHEPRRRDVGDRVRDAGYGDAGRRLARGREPRLGHRPEGDARTGSSTRGSTAAGHRRIMLASGYREFGIGVARGSPKGSSLPGATYTMNLGVIALTGTMGG